MFVEKIPSSLWGEVKQFITELDYLGLLNCSKRVFQGIKKETRKIMLRDDDAEDFIFLEAFQENIQAKIVSFKFQVMVRINEIILRKHDMAEIVNLLSLLDASYELYLTDSDVVDLTPLSTVKNLQTVSLRNCNQLENVTCLKSVQKLVLDHCDKINNISDLGQIPWLRIDTCKGITNGVPKGFQSQNLQIRHCINMQLKNSVFQHLKVIETDRLTRSVDVMKLKNVEILSLHFYEDSEFPFLPTLSKLVLSQNSLKSTNNLHLLKEFQCKYNNYIESIDGLDSVLRLEIWACPKLTLINCSFVKTKRITLHACYRLKTAPESVCSVPVVIIDECDHFETIPMGNWKIKDLSVHYCPAFVLNQTTLAAWKNLRRLSLVGIDVAKFSLNSFDESDTSIHPIGLIPELEIRHCFHYSLLENIFRNGENQRIILSTIEYDFNQEKQVSLMDFIKVFCEEEQLFHCVKSSDDSPDPFFTLTRK
jgi:hypothetical protein